MCYLIELNTGGGWWVGGCEWGAQHAGLGRTLCGPELTYEMLGFVQDVH